MNDPTNQLTTAASAQHPDPKADALLLSVDNTARHTGLSRGFIYKLLADGRLESVKVGRRRLIRFQSVKRLASGEVA